MWDCFRGVLSRVADVKRRLWVCVPHFKYFLFYVNIRLSGGAVAALGTDTRVAGHYVLARCGNPVAIRPDLRADWSNGFLHQAAPLHCTLRVIEQL